MHHHYRIALLEDNIKQLEKLESYLSKIPNLEIVLKSKTSDHFFEEVQLTHPDILIADLDLGSDSMTGMEVAQEIKIPAFFASINTADYVENMEALKRDAEICVDHLTKPFTEEQFVKSFKRFLQEVAFFNSLQYVYLDFNKTKKNAIPLQDIVYLCADKKAGSESNNKQIHFINRQSENLIDFSFSKMEDKGFLKNQFLTVHKSFRVNRKYIKCYNKKTETIEISIYDGSGKTKSHHLPVSENYQIGLKKELG
ncbi:LytTR family transcriptional regulator DNA-binding domain-containing protein [Kaistella sp. G5-32]|uniref:LytTR family transcriptional regulator DNA-binding domain-containing protein n=1 Tax=Kaistella gelatinilytica TaxID=2787636 RepID=A0ABS0F8Z1_9FLAO|nr:LytTR family transcriptional regulator DNA-binding domain-containing protein [Kaistella gelatinilytica]MBF8456173.1 LytTR family transcriptional regulator DNA-binding domain-containing protein [Kaistella gelatinilytica]